MTLVFFLEEPSAKAMLQGLMPRLLPDYSDIKYIVYEGKQDLLKRVHLKLRNWLAPNTHFVILLDKDAQKCHELKAEIKAICTSSNKPDTLIRIVCHELESWYLGDLQSVETALNITGLHSKQKSKFNSPDDLIDPKGDLKRLTKEAYQPVGSSREIGKVLSITGNLSTSFGFFISGIQGLTLE